MLRFSAQSIRLDQAVAQHAQTSRARAQEWIEAGVVRVDGVVVTKAAFKLKGETIELTPPPQRPSTVEAEDIHLEVLYEDDDLAVVCKPAGMITHPAPGVTQGTLVNALLGRYGGVTAEGERPEDLRPGIVHRLDKDTSGVMVVARHDAAHRRLSDAFAGRQVFKRYIAIAVGQPRQGIISAPLGRHPVDRVRMHVNGVAARHAETDFEWLAQQEGHTLVSAVLHTGRTHQIRVHLKHLQAPVLADSLYGKASPLLERQALHAYELRFAHPRTGKIMGFCAPVPADMVQAWQKLGGTWPQEIRCNPAE